MSRSDSALAARSAAEPNAAFCGAERAKTLKPDLARAFRLARTEAGFDQADLHKRPRLVASWENSDEPHAPTLLNLLVMPRAIARALLRWAGAFHKLIVTDAPAVLDEPPAARSLRLLTECTDVPRAMAARCADGRDELNELERELAETRECVSALTEHEAYLVRRIAEERGDA